MLRGLQAHSGLYSVMFLRPELTCDERISACHSRGLEQCVSSWPQAGNVFTALVICICHEVIHAQHKPHGDGCVSNPKLIWPRVLQGKNERAGVA